MFVFFGSCRYETLMGYYFNLERIFKLGYWYISLFLVHMSFQISGQCFCSIVFSFWADFIIYVYV